MSIKGFYVIQDCFNQIA